MATTSHIISATSLTFSSPRKRLILPQNTSSLLNLNSISSTKYPKLIKFNIHHQKFATLCSSNNAVLSSSNPSPVSTNSYPASSSTFYGVCYVVGDEVGTDQIIPSSYSKLNPSNPDEYNRMGLQAFDGLPKSYALRFMEENGVKSKYSVIIAGKTFGHGLSKDHAIAALNAAGVRAVVAESYGGNFDKILELHNGKFLCLESEVRICVEFKTGDVATIDVEEGILTNQTTGKVFELKPPAHVSRS